MTTLWVKDYKLCISKDASYIISIVHFSLTEGIINFSAVVYLSSGKGKNPFLSNISMILRNKKLLSKLKTYFLPFSFFEIIILTNLSEREWENKASNLKNIGSVLEESIAHSIFYDKKYLFLSLDIHSKKFIF